MTCPCRCGKPVPTTGGRKGHPRKYASAGCCGRVLFRTTDPAMLRVWHQQAQRASAVAARMRLFERLYGLSSDAAVQQAYWLGYSAGWKAKQRRRGASLAGARERGAA